MVEVGLGLPAAWREGGVILAGGAVSHEARHFFAVHPACGGLKMGVGPLDYPQIEKG